MGVGELKEELIDFGFRDIKCNKRESESAVTGRVVSFMKVLLFIESQNILIITGTDVNLFNINSYSTVIFIIFRFMVSI